MNKTTTFSLLVAVLMMNQACKSTSTTAAATTPATATPTPTTTAIPGSSADVIAHTFSNGCIGSGNVSSKTTYAFTSSTVGLITEYYYLNGSCNSSSQWFTSAMSFTYSPGAIDSSTGRFNVDITGGYTILTPMSVTGAQLMNSQVTNNVTGICGYTSWTNGTPVNMTTGVSCAGEQLIPYGTIRYASMWLTGTTGSLTLTLDTASRTTCSGNMDQSSGTRCTTASTNANEILIQTQ